MSVCLSAHLFVRFSSHTVYVDYDYVDDSISDPERVFKAVVSRGCDHWYSLCLQMGYSRGQVADITNGIPSNADKIRAAFDIKIDAVGESNATAALLEACRRIPNPIIGGVMDILSK